MKKLFLGSFLVFSFLSNSQCKYQFSKITKFEEGFQKDGYGNVTDNRTLKCTLTDGSKVSVPGYGTEFANDWQNSYGVANLLFAGTNASKTAFIKVIKNNQGISVQGYYFKKSSSDKKFSWGQMDWDPSIDNAIGTRPYYDGFSPSQGWAFSKVVGDVVVMTKNGVEYKFSSNNKTQESYCNMYFKMQ